MKILEFLTNILIGAGMASLLIESAITCLNNNHKFKWINIFGYYLAIIAANLIIVGIVKCVMDGMLNH